MLAHLICRIAVLLLAIGRLTISADRVLEDETTRTLVFRKIAVPVTTFSRPYAMQRAREFLVKNTQFKIIRLTLVPDEDRATYSAFGCDHCPPYQFWRMQWDSITPLNYPVAELLSIDGNAILRFRTKNGAVSVTILQGSDPRQIRLGNYKGKIIHVGMEGRVDSPVPCLYVVGSGKILSKDGSSFARKLAMRLDVHVSWIEFRADPWFIGQIWTPFFPFFDTTGSPPSEQTFKRSKTPTCSYFSNNNNECSWKGLMTLP